MKTMKKLISLLLGASMLMAGATTVSASELILSDTTWVNVDNTSDVIFAKPTDAEYHAGSNYYMHFKTGGDWLEVNQPLTEEAVAGSQYVMTVVAKPVTGTAWFRVGWDDTAWLASSQLDLAQDLGDGWYKYVKTVTMTANQSSLLFHNEGNAEIYVDSISLKPVDSDKELMSNGGFDSVNYDAEADIIIAKSTNVNVANTEAMFAKMLWEAKEADNTYSLHFKTNGDWLEASQSLTKPLTAGQYVLTAYGKGIEGKIWFYVNWDETGWMATHAADIIEPQPDGWTKYQKTITVDGEGDTNLLFHSDGATEFYLDDISLVAVGDSENLIPDGGFGEVTVPGQEPEIPEVEPEFSSTTKVNMENTDTCFAKPSSTEYRGESNYYMQFVTNGDWLEVSQNLTEEIVAGGQYVMTVVAKPVKGTVWFRVGWDDAGWLSSGQLDLATDLGDGWYKYVKTVTLAANQTNFLFHNDGATECYVDSISLMPIGEDKELLVNGGFDAVSFDAESGVITADKTTINVQNSDAVYTNILSETKKAEGEYSLHFKATAADWLEVSQTLTKPLTAGEYVLTLYAKPVSGRVWFRISWDDTGWLASHQTEFAQMQPDGWTKYQKTITVDGIDDTTFLFHNDGEAEFYIDDISLVAVGDSENLIPDGGFNEVIIPGQEPEVKYVISDVEFTGLDADGKIKAGRVGVKATVLNKEMGDNFAAIMVAVLYDGGRMVSASTLKQSVPASAGDNAMFATEFGLGVDVPELTEISDYEIKVMFFDGFNTFNLLGKVDKVK